MGKDGRIREKQGGEEKEEGNREVSFVGPLEERYGKGKGLKRGRR